MEQRLPPSLLCLVMWLICFGIKQTFLCLHRNTDQFSLHIIWCIMYDVQT